MKQLIRYLLTNVVILYILLFFSPLTYADKHTQDLSQKFQAAANTCSKIHTKFLGRLAKGSCIKSCTGAAKRTAALSTFEEGKKQIKKDLKGCIFTLDLSKTKTQQLDDLKNTHKLFKAGKWPKSHVVNSK